MPAPYDLTGKSYGRLAVEGLADPTRTGLRLWRCRCACGAIVDVTTNGLTSGRVDACTDCGGPRPAPRVVDRICVACRSPFRGHSNAIVCSNECRKARRRGIAAGVDALPPPVRPCEICGRPFHMDRGLRTCCSKSCLKERRRRRGREAWRRRIARRPELAHVMAERRREKAARDPAYARRLREWEARKWETHRGRMRADPAYAATIRERANAHYAAHAGEILARRKARLDAMPPAELDAWLARARRYCRRWRKIWREELVKDTVVHERYREFYREYRRRLAGRTVAFAIARLEGELNERISGS